MTSGTRRANDSVLLPADSAKHQGRGRELWAACRAGIRRRPIALVFVLCCLLPAAAQAVHPGAYVCAVDNCKKSYHQQGKSLFEACREGAAHAANSAPSSAECLQMCQATYSATDSAQHDACTTGCALYPPRCLRFGELPPKDEYLRDTLRP